MSAHTETLKWRLCLLASHRWVASGLTLRTIRELLCNPPPRQRFVAHTMLASPSPSPNGHTPPPKRKICCKLPSFYHNCTTTEFEKDFPRIQDSRTVTAQHLMQGWDEAEDKRLMLIEGYMSFETSAIAGPPCSPFQTQVRHTAAAHPAPFSSLGTTLRQSKWTPPKEQAFRTWDLGHLRQPPPLVGLARSESKPPRSR